MATKTIAWNSGGGNIVITYTGSGNGSLSAYSTTENASTQPRSQTVTIKTTAGSNQKTRTLTIKQAPYEGLPVGTTYNFGYTGTVQSKTLPAGRYKLQCWGAQGGSVSGSYTATGSKGGYSEGVLVLTQTTTLYIFVGGKGTDSSTSSTSGTVNGGWNGGGGSVRYSDYNSGDEYGESFPRPGGGATDIALVTSGMDFSSYRNNRTSASLLSRILVAGGGAGASARYTEEEVTTNTERETHLGRFTCKQYAQFSSGYTNQYLYNGIEPGGYRIIIPTNTGLTGFQIQKRTAADVSVGEEYWYAGGTYDFSVPDTVSFLRFIFIKADAYIDESLSFFDLYRLETSSTTDTETSSGKSNASQQGGGTSGKGQYPGTQSSAGSGGAFGFGANQTTTNYRYVSGAGGGGWYGGGSNQSDSSKSYINYSGGGSGFVNTADNAGYRPSGYTGLELESGSTTAGDSYFEAASGGSEQGHAGDGYARITVLDSNGSSGGGGGSTTPSITWATQTGTWNQNSNSSAKDGKQFTCVSPGSSGSTRLRCTFSGLTSITFRCRYQGESNYDYLTVGNIDTTCSRSSYGTTLKGTSGTWKSITFTPSTTGEHFVEFCYSKDGSVDTSPDNAVVYIESYS